MSGVNNDIDDVPPLICLDDFHGDYTKFIEAVYAIFYNDFVIEKNRPQFRGVRLGLKKHPIQEGKEYTFYHITSTGKDEADRNPDLRRCERIRWAKPVISECDNWNLKVWPQIRNGKNRICIWLEMENDIDYIMILDNRGEYYLPWTTFTLQYSHEKRKKQKEYDDYIKSIKA